MSDLVFLDTETTGLGPDDDIWEFAAIKLHTDGKVEELHLFVDHDRKKAQYLPTQFFTDYRYRFGRTARIVDKPGAARRIQEFTLGCTIIGCVPNFDTEMCARLLRSQELEPKWLHHLIDVGTLAVGWLTAKGKPPNIPWRSDEISNTLGVNPDDFDRHTAMGDAEWAKAQYDAIMKGTDQ